MEASVCAARYAPHHLCATLLGLILTCAVGRRGARPRIAPIRSLCFDPASGPPPPGASSVPTCASSAASGAAGSAPACGPFSTAFRAAVPFGTLVGVRLPRDSPPAQLRRADLGELLRLGELHEDELDHLLR